MHDLPFSTSDFLASEMLTFVIDVESSSNKRNYLQKMQRVYVQIELLLSRLGYF